jgi:hypothetical protein
MAGLVPAIHVFLFKRAKDVDARDERGHDEQLTKLATLSLTGAQTAN